MNLNDLFERQGIDPAKVIVMRHRPHERELAKVLPWLAAERPETFNAYQQTQGDKVERAMKGLEGDGFVASFIGHTPGQALFMGLYTIDASRPLTREQYWNVPAYREMKTFGIQGFTEQDASKRSKVLAALKDPSHKNDRDHVDIIIALGMAKEGFDWIWCEHALTVGYRSSLTEIIQIIGRATRDAPGKEEANFTNLIAEPDAAEATVVDAINDTLKAIAASLLMEQVLAPRFNFTPKDAGPMPDFDYGEGGYVQGQTNVGFNEERGQFHFEIKGLVEPKSPEANRICQEDLNEVITAFVQDKTALERGMFDEETVPEELTQVKMGNIVRERYPELDAEDQEAVRQHAIAALNLTQRAKQLASGGDAGEGDAFKANTALLDGVRKFAMDVRDLDIDLIDRINPFEAAYAVLAKSMSEGTLKQVAAVIEKRKVSIPYEEARDLAIRALKWKQERGRAPEITAQDPWEKRLAEGVAALAKFRSEQAANG